MTNFVENDIHTNGANGANGANGTNVETRLIASLHKNGIINTTRTTNQ